MVVWAIWVSYREQGRQYSVLFFYSLAVALGLWFSIRSMFICLNGQANQQGCAE